MFHSCGERQFGRLLEMRNLEMRKRETFHWETGEGRENGS